MDNDQNRTQILHAGELLLLSSQLPPEQHTACAAAATAPASVDPVLADDLAWAIKMSSVTHEVYLAELDHWRRTQLRTLLRVTSACVQARLGELFTNIPLDAAVRLALVLGSVEWPDRGAAPSQRGLLRQFPHAGTFWVEQNARGDRQWLHGYLL